MVSRAALRLSSVGGILLCLDDGDGRLTRDGGGLDSAGRHFLKTQALATQRERTTHRNKNTSLKGSSIKRLINRNR